MIAPEDCTPAGSLAAALQLESLSRSSLWRCLQGADPWLTAALEHSTTTVASCGRFALPVSSWRHHREVTWPFLLGTARRGDGATRSWALTVTPSGTLVAQSFLSLRMPWERFTGERDGPRGLTNGDTQPPPPPTSPTA